MNFLLRTHHLCFLLLLLFYADGASAEERILEIKVGDTIRQALVISPTEKRAKKKCPLIFVFHGRTGNMHGASHRMAIHQYRSDAIVVYPQGLWVDVGRFKGNGWIMPTPNNEGRDIAFFDVLFEKITREYDIDHQRIYAMGHSNGGGFTHALWALRGDMFAAFAPSSSGSGRLWPRIEQQQPKPILFIAGKQDEIVPISTTQRCITKAIDNNRCRKRKKIDKSTTIYKSAIGADVWAHTHEGGHKFHQDALPLIGRFFAKYKKE